MDPTWAIVAATFLGPLSAVGITLFAQDRASRRERKTTITRLLVGNRNLRANVDFGAAISMIPFEFSDNKKVIAARTSLLARVNDPAPETPEKLAEIDNLLSDLIAEMLLDLGYRFDHSAVRSLAYTPNIVGWRDGLYLDSLRAQLRISNDLAKSAFYSRKLASKADALDGDEEPPVPFPGIEPQKP